MSFLNRIKTENFQVSLYVTLTYFFVLFSYPFVRSATGSLFYEHYTSADYSFAYFISVVVLMAVIFINNKIQTKIGIHKTFVLTGLLSIGSLLIAFYYLKSGVKEMAYVLFAVKEAYIVLLIHTCLAFINNYYTLDIFKKIIGPIGAIGAIGGVVGGQLTKVIAQNDKLGTESVFYVSLVLIFFTIFFFFQTRHIKVKGQKDNQKVTPLEAIKGVRKYIFYIAAIVALSQIVIFIADLQFNMVFEKVVTLKNERTAYLGNFYSYINLLSFVLQFLLMPFLLPRVSLKTIFMFVPLFYMVLVFGGLGFGATQIIVVSSVFIFMKGTDYSIFSIAKEVMYHPLLSLQKYGAKYITDMFVYRLAKGIIAFIMAQQFMKSYANDMLFLGTVQFVCLVLWIVLIVLLFKEQKKLKK